MDMNKHAYIKKQLSTWELIRTRSCNNFEVHETKGVQATKKFAS